MHHHVDDIVAVAAVVCAVDFVGGGVVVVVGLAGFLAADEAEKKLWHCLCQFPSHYLCTPRAKMRSFHEHEALSTLWLPRGLVFPFLLSVMQRYRRICCSKLLAMVSNSKRDGVSQHFFKKTKNNNTPSTNVP